MSTLQRDGARWVSASGTRWSAVIGLEVHAQLATCTKLFCGCAYSFGAPPNSLVCVLCTGQPGTLPVLNAEALALAVRVALSVGADVAELTHFDRKHYFYCDLPKNYQISQLDRPFCTGGGIELSSGKQVRLNRIHLEEDAGKGIHDRGPGTLVDLNRAGVPLIESVTEADIETPEEAVEYLLALKEVLQFVGASSADMEKGELRCDVNVSVRPEGEPWRTKVEVKNLNSFKNVQAALEHEIPRQIAAYEAGDPEGYPRQETRLFDPGSGATRVMRTKEGAVDYRYFPEPDLPVFELTQSFVEDQRRTLPELPAARRARYVRELGLTDYDAGVLTGSRAIADFFEAVARLSGRPKEAANWIGNEVLRALSDAEFEATSIDELRATPHDVAVVIQLVSEGRVNVPGARTVLRECLKTGEDPRELVKSLGLEQVRDEAAVLAWCRAAMTGNARAVDELRSGKEKAIGALVGAVMKASGGKADPAQAKETLLRLVADGEGGTPAT